ncbi:hypothetical protein BaRGS_00002445 [Batillaria attramentaria]|uniref:Uncharacterized protein n=1 Tax=Batillaria attramentaria TaxID=370345 RepID=A0ABD0M3Q4_9CAEN
MDNKGRTKIIALSAWVFSPFFSKAQRDRRTISAHSHFKLNLTNCTFDLAQFTFTVPLKLFALLVLPSPSSHPHHHPPPSPFLVRLFNVFLPPQKVGCGGVRLDRVTKTALLPVLYFGSPNCLFVGARWWGQIGRAGPASDSVNKRVSAGPHLRQQCWDRGHSGPRCGGDTGRPLVASIQLFSLSSPSFLCPGSLSWWGFPPCAPGLTRDSRAAVG